MRHGIVVRMSTILLQTFLFVPRLFFHYILCSFILCAFYYPRNSKGYYANDCVCTMVLKLDELHSLSHLA
jgi:hypothetical protein